MIDTADVKWIKLYIDMFDNRKIKFIRKLPEGSDILLCWIMLLASAGRCNTNGFIFLTENIPYTVDMLASEFDLPVNTVRLALETFKKLDMLNEEDGVLCVTAWGEYQSVDRLDKIREYDKERKRLARQKIQQIPQECPADSPTDVQGQSSGLDIDKEIDKDINYVEKLILHELIAVKDYPFDYQKDLAFIRKLSIEFPKSDVLESIKKWTVWLLDHPLKKTSNPRSQIRNFVKPKAWEKKERKEEIPDL